MAFKAALKLVKFLSPAPKKELPRLVTIGFSHYCEKARWGLDMSPLDYYEEMHCPAMHLSQTLMELNSLPRITAWNTESEFFTSVKSRSDDRTFQRKEISAVPKLVLPRSHVQNFGIEHITEDHAIVALGASGILKFLSRVYPDKLGHLYPEGPLGTKVLELESFIERELASAASDWSFGNLLLTGKRFAATDEDALFNNAAANNKSIPFFLKRATSTDVPLVEKLMFRALGPRLLLPLMIKANGVTSKARDGALERISAVYSFLDNIVQQKAPGKFLFNSDHLTAADITLAVMSMPIVMPAQTHPLFVSLDHLEGELKQGNDQVGFVGLQRMAALAHEIRDKHISARYALELYEHHRLPVTGGSATPKEVQARTLSVRGK